MKKLILALLLILVVGFTAGVSLSAWYFQYRTGFPLLEVYKLKNQCEAKETCVFMYYIIPETDTKPYRYETPETSSI